MGQNADAAENRWLREAMQNGVPIIYFLGTSPGIYKALIPSFVIGWDAAGLIPLAKTHHAAFDAQLIGIDPDFKIHISDRILRQKDGPTLEALKRLDQNRMLLPSRGVDRPDRDRLAQRFEQFKARN